MQQLVANFSNQLRHALTIGKASKITQPVQTLQNVVIAGLGGSGIGGDIAREIVALETTLPITVTKGYFIPGFVGPHTLFIASSYSGNTEETLQAVDEAVKRNAKVVCITSGGKLLELAQAKGFDHIVVPAGFPPRSCLGYSLTQLLIVFKTLGIVSRDVEADLNESIQLLEAEENAIQVLAKDLTEKIHGKTPVLYATTYNEGVVIRFRQQLNENSKLLCWHNIIPEMNHNELVAWRETNHNLAVILFRDADEYARNDFRIDINKQVISKYTDTLIEVFAKGKSPLAKAIYLIHLGDWISCYLAEKRGYDAMEIDVIHNLKKELSRF